MIFLVFWFLILLLIFLAVTGKTLGLREYYVNTLVYIFEWGATLNEQYEEEEGSVEEDMPEDFQHKKPRRSSSASDLGIINREKSDIIDAKLHETNVPEAKQTTVSVLVDDTLDFITAGMEAVIEDQVTNRFSAAQLPSWNLLSRTKYSFHFFNWQLTLLWIAGFMFRYYVLVPCRIALFGIAIVLMIVSTSIIGLVPNAKVRKFLNRRCMLMCMRIYSRAFSSVIRFHDKENRANKGGICVANHTSPIDVMVLSCDNCYAMIGQKQAGFLGFLQTTLSRSEHHIWFERGEAGDRAKVMDRMREHVNDENKLPIIIFPEGTCINNTSVMMFKKGSFEIGSTIYPIAVKYDTRLTDAFWNSSAQSYGRYLWSMMTSWAIICDVWYLPAMTRGENEDSISFAKRVKRAIAKKGGLIDLEWKMWQLLVPLAVLLTVSGQSTDEISHERIFLKYPSSFVNFTSDNWKLTETDNQLIIAVKFQASSHIGQIFSVRFINPDGSLKALLTAGIAAGILQINLYDDKNTKILNKPMENSPINVHEHSLAVGLNTTARNLWYKLGADNDLNCEINQAIDISNTEVTVTIGGGSQSMIGCVSIVAVSAGESSPVSQGTPIAYQDIDECPKADACTTKDCNTGRCIQLEVPTCDCYGTEMAGPNCRLPAPTIQLRNNDENEESSAYLRYKPWEMDSHFSRLSMDFRFSDSDAKEGILVYGETSQGKIFKIYVVGTKGKVMLDTTNVADFELREDHSIFHSIIVKIVDGIFNMLVDDNVHRRAFNESDALVFDTIQFGAPIPTDVSEVGVTACVKNVYVDHVDIIELAVLTNDSRTTASRVRSCNNEDLTEFQGPSLFSADPLAEILVEDPSDIKSEFGESVIGADMFPVPSNKKPKTQPLSSCEKANAYMCQNGAGCKKESETEFTCFCKEGYIGKFCQFTTIPRSCAEAYDFLKLPNGATWVDVDGNRKLDPSVTMCTDGQTEIPHDMKPGYVVRDTTYQNHSLFVLSYRDFNSWQLAKYIKNSGSCSQTVNYRCNKAPLRFKEGKTWFKSVSNATEKIKQIGMLPNSCPCLDRGCQSGEKCNCDSGAISEDIGELTGRYSGICEVVTLFDEADVRAEMTISELKCSGYENEKPIRFTERTELKISDWTGESIDLQFRTTETPASLVTVQGNYGEKIISVSLTDGHTVQISNFEALKIIESQTKLNDSNWHHVLIELADGEIRVTVDATHVLMTIGDNAVLEGSVVLGGEGDGLIGCVRNVLINDEPVNLQEIVKTSEKTGITETCDTRCTADFCQNGAKCYEDFVSGMPFCQCAFPDVHSGVNCEIDINTNSSVSFHGGYLKFDDVKNVLNAPIYFSFRTDRTHALLFFAHDQNNNFLQVHLSEEVNVTLTLNNLDIVSQCTVRAQPGTEYGDMRWIQVAITHDSKSSQLQVDDAACTIRTSRVLSEIPITRLLDVYNSELVGMPVGLAAPVKPNPYTFTFIGNVNTGEKTNDGSFILAPKYESPIPRFYGCIRGFQINREMIDMREKTEHLATSEMYEAYGPALVKVGCEVGCSSITCLNGGHCSVAWANTDPSAATTTCDCSRTSYTGASCSLDEGVHMERSGFIEFDISKEMARYVFIEQNSKIPQLLKFAFSSSPEIVLKDKSMLALVVFREKQKLEIEINPNRTINVAITYENGKSDVLNFVGDFLDGYRHFVVVQTNQASATAVMIDSLRQDFEYRGKDKNIDLFNAERIRIGGGPRDRYTETDGYLKAGYTGCISNFIVDYQRGSSLTYKPITYFANPTHHLSKLIMTNRIVLGGCAAFEVPNSLPVYQNRVKFPVWDTEFRRFVYFRDVEPLNDNNDTEWTDEDSGSLMWVVFIIFVLGVIFLIIFCIFMKCCREKIHARDDEYLHDEDIPLHMAPTILRHPQPSPPPIKKSAASNYKIPNPNIDFNKENTFDYDDEDEFAGIADDNVTDDVTVRNEVDDSDNETIRHIDDEVQDEDGMVIVSRPTQVSHLPQRVSSFRTGDPTAPKDSPLYSNIRPPTSPIHASVPVPPPRMSNNSPFA